MLACLLALILATRFVPYGGEFYATCIYPSLSFVLSLLSSFIPCSLEEILVCLFGALLLLYPLVSLLRRKKHILLGELEIVLWVVAWFYIGWGCNYFRTGFYERLMITPSDYEKDTFLTFLNAYTDSLNTAYISAELLDREAARREIKDLYRQVPPGCGLTTPRSFQEPKKLLFNELYSEVGVLGYMGPFMAESQVNQELSDMEYPFTYAHELSHLLGVSNEAEANCWAFLICSHAENPVIRYSAYNGLLAYVANNARQILTPEEFEQWMHTVSTQALDDEKRVSDYWKSRKNATLNSMQETLYNLFLKSNNIKNGMQNYTEVVGMLIALQESQEEPLRRQGRALSVKQ